MVLGRLFDRSSCCIKFLEAFYRVLDVGFRVLDLRLSGLEFGSRRGFFGCSLAMGHLLST